MATTTDPAVPQAELVGMQVRSHGGPRGIFGAPIHTEPAIRALAEQVDPGAAPTTDGGPGAIR